MGRARSGQGVAGRLQRRRQPRQRRARATADSIRQAALALIAKEGFENLTAARIASRAGVGVGSFYDYFANKDAVLLDLFESASSALARSMRESLGQVLDLPVAEGVEQSITQLLSQYELHRLVLIDLPEEMPELRLHNHPLSFEKLGHGSVLIYLEHRGKLLKPDELEAKAFFVEQILVGCVRQYLVMAPRNLPRETFIGNLVQIIVPYIKDLTPIGRLELSGRRRS